MDCTRSYWNGRKAVHRRTMMKGAGYCDSDIKTKPHIGVANTYMEGSPGTAHLRTLVEKIKQGIWAAGGIPVEFGVPATCGNVANGAEELKYEQAARDIVAASIEFVAKVHRFDGLVTVASCDNIIAGCYLAMARLNIPTLCVTGGSMTAGIYKGQKMVQAQLDVAVLGGESEEVLLELEEHVCPSFGACPSMGTANTMQMTGEIINFVVPGTGTLPSTDNLKLRRSKEAGEMIVEMTKADRKPSDLITRETLMNAIAFAMATAASTNIVLHLIAIANELGIKITLDDFDHYASKLPCIVGVIPSGPYTVVDFHYAGGALTVMKMIESQIYTNVPTMDGRTWKELLANVEAKSSDIIRTLADPLFKEPGLKILKGNLSPTGSIVRPTGVPAEMKQFSGKARVFSSDLDSFAAIERGEIVAGDVIVIRYEGCVGAPGMTELMVTTDALIAHGLHKSVGLISDARFSGFNYGAIVGHVTPEAAKGGLIALIEEGDIISVDTVQGTINLDVPENIIAERRKKWVCPPPKVKTGLLALYAKNCRTADEGGAMQPWLDDETN
ncbi:dihydroxy-acid dehydratase [Acetonema longum]|uniref:Dihydroxy-acid dehydratase n=1 Tax=Acetonema longum DSM 6540 TaxID=1009370 RepID=F7NKL6_9FIRM|nr:dihydroxy-acid dehydratase [Acetonema longum]EGO63424.1 Dihydroxy-acid dehydratase [Acetonema longum DSM 6540]